MTGSESYPTSSVYTDRTRKHNVRAVSPFFMDRQKPAKWSTFMEIRGIQALSAKLGKVCGRVSRVWWVSCCSTHPTCLGHVIYEQGRWPHSIGAAVGRQDRRDSMEITILWSTPDSFSWTLFLVFGQVAIGTWPPRMGIFFGFSGLSGQVATFLGGPRGLPLMYQHSETAVTPREGMPRAPLRLTLTALKKTAYGRSRASSVLC
jgi:hypothetical protein